VLLPTQLFAITNADLERYATVSGDLNPIHLDSAAARAAGFEDTIAHGMLIMALACRVVTDWCHDSGAVVQYSARFVKPVVVKTGKVTQIYAGGTVKEKLPANCVLLDLFVTHGGAKVLTMARATVRLH